MSNNLLLKQQSAAPIWVYDSVTKEGTLTIDGTVVAIFDSNGNLKITGRVLKK